MKRLRFTVEWGEVPPDDDTPPPTDRDALVERADPHAPPLGFGPTPPREETRQP